MSYNAEKQSKKRAETKRHTIVEAGFSLAALEGKPVSEAKILCSCSAEVTSGTWDDHRGILTNATRLLVRDAGTS